MKAVPHPDGPWDFSIASFVDYLKLFPNMLVQDCIPGLLTVVHRDPAFPAWGFIAHYSLILTLLALFYVVLKWVYRKRPGKSPETQ